MTLTLATLEAVLKVLYNGKSQSEVPEEVEFTPFDLSYLRNAPERTRERETPVVKDQAAQPEYAETAA